MQILLIIVLCLHVLPAIAWAGMTMTMARTGGAMADKMFIPQMGAATVAILAGGAIWALTHAGGFGRADSCWRQAPWRRCWPWPSRSGRQARSSADWPMSRA